MPDDARNDAKPKSQLIGYLFPRNCTEDEFVQDMQEFIRETLPPERWPPDMKPPTKED